MKTTVEMQSEYRNLPILSLTESPANPRRAFDETALNELAESIRIQGVLSPLLVRSKDHRYEIVAGARRFRAAQLAGLDAVPVRIVELTDAQAIETSIVENLQRRDVHPLDEASGYLPLLHLDYSVEQIAAKCGKSPAYVACLCCSQHKRSLCCVVAYVQTALFFAKLAFHGHNAPGYPDALRTACSCSRSDLCSSSQGIHALPVSVQCASATISKSCGR